MMKARDALETTNHSVEQIGWDVGYSDVTAFRRVFQRFTGLTPTLYRQRFGVRHNKTAPSGAEPAAAPDDAALAVATDGEAS